MSSTEQQIAIQAIEKAIEKNHVEIGRLQRENGKYSDVLHVLRQNLPVAVDTEVQLTPTLPKKRLAIVYVDSQSGGDEYVCEAWLVGTDLIVLTCTCPAFRYTTGDQWKGERKWCKHLRANYTAMLKTVAFHEARRDFEFRDNAWKRLPRLPRGYRRPFLGR